MLLGLTSHVVLATAVTMILSHLQRTTWAHSGGLLRPSLQSWPVMEPGSSRFTTAPHFMDGEMELL